MSNQVQVKVVHAYGMRIVIPSPTHGKLDPAIDYGENKFHWIGIGIKFN